MLVMLVSFLSTLLILVSLGMWRLKRTSASCALQKLDQSFEKNNRVAEAISLRLDNDPCGGGRNVFGGGAELADQPYRAYNARIVPRGTSGSWDVRDIQELSNVIVVSVGKVSPSLISHAARTPKQRRRYAGVTLFDADILRPKNYSHA